ncbi:MAG: hypothetical protein M3O50_01525 [Myxococcota bacterium]|nr:hypothetical protein [Myxococcota bacterium]
MPRPEERRRQRSEDPLVALDYQLARTRSVGGFDAVVVADEAGLVVAGAGGAGLCEELAAHAPLIARGFSNQRLLDPQWGSSVIRPEINVHVVEVERQIVLLCARGGNAGSSALRQAAVGVARILTRAA